MSEEIGKQLTERLQGKPILFVDDQRSTVGNYMSRLYDLNLRCELVSSLDDALVRINAGGLGLAILDLYMPPPRAQ